VFFENGHVLIGQFRRIKLLKRLAGRHDPAPQARVKTERNTIRRHFCRIWTKTVQALDWKDAEPDANSRRFLINAMAAAVLFLN
jgi:hypothetical protein